MKPRAKRPAKKSAPRPATKEEKQVEHDATVEELRASIEELEVAQEELRQQYRELTDTQTALQAERTRYVTLFESAPLAYVVTDPHGTVREANRAAGDLFALRTDFLIGKPLALFVLKEETPDFRRRLAYIAAKGGREIWEAPFTQRTGQKLWVEVTAAATSDQGSRVVSIRWILRDITESKRAAEALKRQAAQLEVQASLLNLTHETIIVRDFDATILFWNRGAEEMYGWPAGEALGKKTHDFLQTRFPISLAQLNEALREKGRWEGELIHTRRDGRTLTVQSRQVVQRTPEVERSRILEINSDITERKRDEERIRQLNAQLERRVEERTAEVQDLSVRQEEIQSRLAAIVESSNDPIIGINMDGLIQSWNAGAEQLFGYTAEEAIGQPISLTYPPGQEEQFADVIRRLREGDRVEHFETVRIRKDGKPLEVSLSVSPIRNAAGEIIGAAKIVRDISTEKRGREAERFLSDASAALASSLDYAATLEKVARLAVPFLADFCAVFVLEEDGNLRSVAVAHRDPAKEESLRELLRRAPPILEHADFRDVLESGQPRVMWQVTDSYWEQFASDHEVYRLTHQLAPRSYMIVPMTARGRALGAIMLTQSQSGRYYESQDLAVAENLAARAALAIDNARLYFESQAAVVARDQFLSVASHEVRTPLTVIQGYTQLLKKQAEAARDDPDALVVLDREKLLRTLQNVDFATARLATLMGDLLDVSRMRDRAMHVSPERVNLSELLQSVIDSVRGHKDHREQGRSVEFRLVLPEDGAVWGDWDRVRIEQVFVNLVDNALKYSPPGAAVTVELCLEQAAEDGDGAYRAHVTVGDEGIGIPPDEMNRLFQPFIRLTNATARHYPGLGLGLAVTKEIVNRHGGHIWAESEGTDRGATFHVVLPGATKPGKSA